MNPFYFYLFFIPFGYYTVLFILRDKYPKGYLLLQNDLNERVLTFILREKRDTKAETLISEGKDGSKKKKINYPSVINPIKSQLEINKEKGDLFEKQIVEKFEFTKEGTNYEFLEWRGDKYHEGNYPVSNKAPDLLVAFTDDKTFERTEFLVECKYRAKFKEGRIDLNKYVRYRQTGIKEKLEKIKEYKEYSNKLGIKAYLALGVGDCPYRTETIYIIPMDRLFDNGYIYKKHIENFKREFPSHKMKFNRDEKKLF